MYTGGNAPGAFSLYEMDNEPIETNLLWGNTNLNNADGSLMWKYTECTYVAEKSGLGAFSKWISLEEKKSNIQKCLMLH